MENIRRYRKKADQFVVAIQISSGNRRVQLSQMGRGAALQTRRLAGQ